MWRRAGPRVGPRGRPWTGPGRLRFAAAGDAHRAGLVVRHRQGDEHRQRGRLPCRRAAGRRAGPPARRPAVGLGAAQWSGRPRPDRQHPRRARHERTGRCPRWQRPAGRPVAWRCYWSPTACSAGYIAYITFIVAFLKAGGAGPGRVSVFWVVLGVAAVGAGFAWGHWAGSVMVAGRPPCWPSSPSVRCCPCCRTPHQRSTARRCYSAPRSWLWSPRSPQPPAAPYPRTTGHRRSPRSPSPSHSASVWPSARRCPGGQRQRDTRRTHPVGGDPRGRDAALRGPAAPRTPALGC